METLSQHQKGRIIMNISQKIRKHELIVERLKAIKDMESILNGENPIYKKHMGEKTFIRCVKSSLECEKMLLEELYEMDEDE